MAKTELGIDGRRFLVNGRPVYSEITGAKPNLHGLLMNARFIQGIFDDRAAPERFARFGYGTWDAEANTDRLIQALPEWYGFGLRAFTVGLQGGGPCFTVDNDTIDNNPFGKDGKSLDKDYSSRLDRLIRACDEIGMVVIVSFFYGAQARRIQDGAGIRNAVVTAARFLKDRSYTNIIVEVANEQNIGGFNEHPIIQEDEGMAWLMDLARQESGGIPVGCSGGGGHRSRQIVEASDVVLVHGNGQTRQKYYSMIQEVRGWAPNKPIVCNEDSQSIGQLTVAELTATSWGYYNNMTKQEPPAKWDVLPGEDAFFALRMAEMIGIKKPRPVFEDQYYLQGFELEMTDNAMRWPRVASLNPESINYVEFFRNGGLYYTSFDEPFSVHFKSNWRQGGVRVSAGEEWQAKVHLRNGNIVTKSASLAGSC